jgi:hypothetical protein
MYDFAALEFTLTDAGSFSVPTGQTLSAAISITDTAAGSQNAIKFYIDNIVVSKTGSEVTLSVPNTAVAWVYVTGTDNNNSAFAQLTNFNSTVANASATLSTATNTPSHLVLGSALNSAINGVGSASAMSGTYKVTMVVTNLAISQQGGTPLKTYTIDVPKSLAPNGAVRSITGLGFEGYITLTPR